MSCLAASCPGPEQPSLKPAPSPALRDTVQPPLGHRSPCSAHPIALSFSHHMCYRSLTGLEKLQKAVSRLKTGSSQEGFLLPCLGFHAPFLGGWTKVFFPLANSHSCLPAMGCGTRSTLGDVWGCFPRDLWVSAPKEGWEQPC